MSFQKLNCPVFFFLISLRHIYGVVKNTLFKFSFSQPRISLIELRRFSNFGHFGHQYLSFELHKFKFYGFAVLKVIVSFISFNLYPGHPLCMWQNSSLFEEFPK